jgi:hypothetical protein
MQVRPAVGRAGSGLVAVVLAVLLAGCVKLDADLDVASDNTFGGAYIVGIKENLAKDLGQTPDKILSEAKASLQPKSLPKGATVKFDKYSGDGFVGVKMTVAKMPISNLGMLAAGAAGTTGQRFTLTRDGNLFHFNGTLDLTTGLANLPITLSPDVASSAQIRVKLTFPGDVTETNGTKNGRSVTWTPKLGQKVDLTATANAKSGSSSNDSSDGNGLAIFLVAAGIVVLLVVGLVAWALARRGRPTPAPTRDQNIPPAPPHPADPTPTGSGRPLPPPRSG